MEGEQASLEIWKVTIDVQKHFNELSMRVRSIAVTVLAAFLAAAGYALKGAMTVVILGQTVSLAALTLAAGLLCWAAFYLMDRHWYHRLLRGAVAHGIKVEEALAERLPIIGLTGSIAYVSPMTVWGVKTHARHRLDIFYGIIGLLLLAAAIVALFSH